MSRSDWWSVASIVLLMSMIGAVHSEQSSSVTFVLAWAIVVTHLKGRR